VRPSRLKAVLYVIAAAEALVIVLLVMRGKHTEQLTTDLARGHLLAEATKIDALLIQIDNGHLDSATTMMRNIVSNNAAILNSRAFGELNAEQAQVATTLLHQYSR
jgi:hypothetical protein